MHDKMAPPFTKKDGAKRKVEPMKGKKAAQKPKALPEHEVLGNEIMARVKQRKW